MISKLILDRLFVTPVGAKYHFTPETTFCSLSLIDLLLNNWFKVQSVNQIVLRLMRGWGSLFKGLDLVFMGITYLLSLKNVGVNFVLHPISPAIHPVLPITYFVSTFKFMSKSTILTITYKCTFSKMTVQLKTWCSLLVSYI